MSDTISRQAALDALCAVCGNDCDKSEFVYNAPQDEQVIICPEHYCLCTLPPAQRGWIPVAERLPENDNDVLVTDGTDCAVAYWRTDAQAWDDSMHGWCDLYGLEVTAWMPLPTPYREGGTG